MMTLISIKSNVTLLNNNDIHRSVYRTKWRISSSFYRIYRTKKPEITTATLGKVRVTNI